MSGAAQSRPDVGGQAVIEGVMMRSPKSFTVVCRRPDGSIVIKEEAWRPFWSRARFLRWPFVRGAIVLLESITNGVSALTFSADQQEDRQPRGEGTAPEAPAAAPEPDAPARGDAGPAGTAAAASTGEEDRGGSAATYGMVALSLAFGLALFVGAPHLVAWGLGSFLGFTASDVIFHVVDGAIKLVVLVGYMAAISLLPDVKRVFQYHGAEHKAIFTYEHGLELTVDNARAQTRFHPRCGTSFLLIVIMVSVAVFAAALSHPIAHAAVADNLIKILIKIPLMFPVAGLAYEGIKLAGRHCDTSRVAKLASLPGMWLQRITTREPDDEQLEIALISIRKTLWREQQGEGTPEERAVEVYRSADDIALPLAA